VLVLDVTEEEADKILLTLDPLAGMAEANQAAIEELLKNSEEIIGEAIEVDEKPPTNGPASAAGLSVEDLDRLRELVPAEKPARETS
jgi:hypothetical protein